MKVIVFDPHPAREDLLPMTYTRPVGDLRLGLMTIAERWQMYLPGEYFWLTEAYLTELFPAPDSPDDDTLYVAGNVIADASLAAAVAALKSGETLTVGGTTVAYRGTERRRVDYTGAAPIFINQLYDIFMSNDAVIKADYAAVTAGRTGAPVSSTCTIIGDPSMLFLEEGVQAECAVFNVSHGPIYLGRDTEVMEGAVLRGPIATAEHCAFKLGAKVYGATTLGPHCKMGGEISNVVVQGYTNKAHDGFLGNAVIGQWCNLGAGCTASNLKNNYAEIRLWNYRTNRFRRTGLQFCGLIMGDHSKAGINTAFNTATVVGVGCNIVSAGMPRVFIPSFSKGGSAGFDDVSMLEFFDTARRVMARRSMVLTPAAERMFNTIRDTAEAYR